MLRLCLRAARAVPLRRVGNNPSPLVAQGVSPFHATAHRTPAIVGVARLHSLNVRCISTDAKAAASIPTTSVTSVNTHQTPLAAVDVFALHAQGEQLIHGRGIRKDVPAGILILRRAAAAGHIPSCNSLVRLFICQHVEEECVPENSKELRKELTEKGVGVQPDEAVAIARHVAMLRDPVGLLHYGSLLGMGLPGVLERDPIESARMCREAALLGAEASIRAAKEFEYVVTPFDEMSDGEVKVAAVRGDADAIRCYGVRLEQLAKKHGKDRVREGVLWLKWAAEERGDRAAQKALVRLHNKGALAKDMGPAVTQWHRLEAMEGDRGAQHHYGMMLCEGLGGAKKDVAEGLVWLERAGDAGHSEALVDASTVLMSRGADEDFGRAVRLLRKAANLNHSQAMGLLACALSNGRGVEKNEAEAFAWLKKVVDYHSPNANMVAMLGAAYINGKGVAKDVQRGMALMRRAAEAEDVAAARFLAMHAQLPPEVLQRVGDISVFPEDPKESPSLDASHPAQAQATAGVQQAMVDLAAVHADGLQRLLGKGRRKDVAEGMRRLRQAAAAGHAASCNVLCALYAGRTKQYLPECFAHFHTFFGDPTSLDAGHVGAEEAVELVRRSAAKLDPEGLLLYGCLHMSGVPGVLRKNVDETRRLARESAVLGHAEAGFLANMIEYGDTGYEGYSDATVDAAAARGDDAAIRCYSRRLLVGSSRGMASEDVRARVRWLLQMAEGGNVDAQKALVVLHHAGVLVPDEWPSVAGWCVADAESGGREAQYNLGMMLCKGLGAVKQDVAEGLVWLLRAGVEGHTGALRAAATLLAKGEGVKADLPCAIRLWRKAAELNDPEAMERLSDMLMLGGSEEGDEVEAVKWLKKVVDYHLPTVGRVTQLGACYMAGVGVTRDVQRGVELLRRAAEAEEEVLA